MITMLNRKHNIVSVSPEDLPEKRQGMFIAYSQKLDAVIIAGWEEDTALILEIIIEYLELNPSQHKEALSAAIHMGLSDADLNVCEALEEIYQIRHKETQREAAE